MPLFPETGSRRAWRRQVAAHLVERVDACGQVRFVGHTMETRREMLKVARLLPSDVIVEIYEDTRYPGRTYMELYLAEAPRAFDPGFRVVYPDQAVG